jgi:hypothetical protein
LDTDPPLWPGPAKGATGRRKLYAFTQAFEEFPLAAEILIPRGTKELKVDKILVRNKRQTQRVGIRHSVPRILHCQQIWWSITGKKFPLLSLPAHLRALIFKHALGTNIHPDIRYNQTLGSKKSP